MTLGKECYQFKEIFRLISARGNLKFSENLQFKNKRTYLDVFPSSTEIFTSLPVITNYMVCYWRRLFEAINNNKKP